VTVAIGASEVAISIRMVAAAIVAVTAAVTGGTAAAIKMAHAIVAAAEILRDPPVVLEQGRAGRATTRLGLPVDPARTGATRRDPLVVRAPGRVGGTATIPRGLPVDPARTGATRRALPVVRDMDRVGATGTTILRDRAAGLERTGRIPPDLGVDPVRRPTVSAGATAIVGVTVIMTGIVGETATVGVTATVGTIVTVIAGVIANGAGLTAIAGAT
jgi:hypothetical protein